MTAGGGGDRAGDPGGPRGAGATGDPAPRWAGSGRGTELRRPGTGGAAEPARRRVVVTGAGVLSPLGDSAGGLHRALCEGWSGLRPIELFATDGMGPRRAGEIRPFDPQSYLGERNLRPLDRTSRLLVVAAGLALADSGWTAERRAAHDVGLVLGTMFCSLRTIAEFDRRSLQLGPSHASPFDFANSVINAAAGQAAIWHGLRGVNSTVAAGEASGLLAIAQAADLIRSGRAEALLAGGAEELCFESFFGMHQAGRLCGGGGSAEVPVPFEARRNGFALAEGAAVLMLEEAGAAAARGARVRAEVLGAGAAFAAGGAGAAAAERRAAAIARGIRLALADAGLAPAEIDFLSAAANGSVAEDRAEGLGIMAAFGERARELPLGAIKSSLGEALGASGAFQVVDLIEVLADGVLPGIAGLERLEEGLELGGASAVTRRLWQGGARISEGRPTAGRETGVRDEEPPRRAVATAWSAGGNCCALVVGGSPAIEQTEDAGGCRRTPEDAGGRRRTPEDAGGRRRRIGR
jgi:3-oxoacyl-[acyl-carrier-protein] synthase II